MKSKTKKAHKKVVPSYWWDFVWNSMDTDISHIVVESLDEEVAYLYDMYKGLDSVVCEAEQLIADLNAGRITKKTAKEKYPKK